MWTQCWLNYDICKRSDKYAESFSQVYIDGFNRNAVIDNAVKEIERFAEKSFGIGVTEIEGQTFDCVILKRSLDESLGEEGYVINICDNTLTVQGNTEKAVLYGVFRLISKIRTGDYTPERAVPSNPVRMLNHWDNMDGSVERGYSGQSFFFENNEIIINERTVDYARFLASVGINAVAINNVNVKDAATDLVNERYIHKVAELYRIFEGYGVKLFLCLNYAMPMEYEPASADPLDDKVIAWWEQKMTDIYKILPGLGGFVVKADSEGRPGPFTYGRTQADGANMLARAIKPHGGRIIWRCFVYNCQQNWRDLKTDRAKAGFDYFSTLDGSFDDNVILQIKNGPMDFQPREPISPLFGGLKDTNQILEVQIAQEYTGHQIDVCYLIPWFKEILGFNTYINGQDNSTVADIISGRAIKGRMGGMAAVTNTGNDENWTGNDLAAANLYGFGRLAFNTDLSAEEIAGEWIKLTLGDDSLVEEIVGSILMKSWPIYEKYTAPLGIGWMVTPHGHYGPNIEGYEYDRWGTYIRADWQGLGVERGPEGTGYSLQYNSPNREMYGDISTTPDELICFFHKVPYTYRLRSGKTVIQHIYDTHFEGYQEVLDMQAGWLKLQDKIDKRAFENVRDRFEMQRLNALEWCDIVNSYFYRHCGIADEKGRTIY